MVADEIRKLAEGTKKAATEIEGMVNLIVESTAAVVGGMTTGTQQVTESIEIINQALGTLDLIGTGAQEITAKAQEISSATADQASAAQQLAKTTEEIALKPLGRVLRQSAGMRSIDFQKVNSAAAKEASSALQKLAGQPVDVKITHVQVIHGAEDHRSFGRNEAVVGVNLPITGDLEGGALLCFPKTDAEALGNRLAGETSTPGRQAVADSALKEVGNIICGRYLSVLIFLKTEEPSKT